MGARFGEIEISQILENEYRIGVLESTIEWILSNNQGFVNHLTPEVLEQIRRDVVGRLQEKYPKSNIGLRGR